MKKSSKYTKGKLWYTPLKGKYIKIIATKIDVNTFKLTTVSVSRDKTNTKTTQTSSKI